MAENRDFNSEDSTGITRGFDNAMSEYTNVSISDVLMAYNGDKRRLAEDLASELDTKYQSQMKNISRWSSGARTPSGKYKEAINNAYRQKRPINSMSIKIHGMIGGKSGKGGKSDFRDRTIEVDTFVDDLDAEKFIQAMSDGDTHAAYKAVFDAYGPELTVAEAYSVDITFNHWEGTEDE